MFPSLFNSTKLKTELKSWTEKANTVSDPKLKQKLLEKISFIRKKADEIDVAHNSSYNGFIKPHLISDTRTAINKARFEVKKILDNT